MASTVSAVEAKARFSDCIRRAEQGETVLITRHGKAVAALVAASDIERLDRLRAAGPAAGLAGLAGGWRGSDSLARVLTAAGRTASRKLRRFGK
jgi:prevent-host-death family protein